MTAARDDLGRFAGLVGWPLAPWQRSALTLDKRTTCLVSPRQCGKSRSLSVLATWWAYRRPKQFVLIVSAGDEAASRLLRTIRDLVAHPLLAGSVVDEAMHRVVLSNGSEIRSVPASERQVRGWTVDLLLVDEAAFVSEDLLVSAALPTTMARPDARVVMASTPWGSDGPFASYVAVGEDEANPHVATFRWSLADAWWVSPAVIESARATMSPLRFAAEFEGRFTASGDALFDPVDLLACTADFPLRRDGERMPAVAGLDWGRRRDAHAVALVGLLEDFGVNARPIVAVPWVETSRRPYGAQLDEITSLARLWSLTIRSETNGVGAYPSERLSEALGGYLRVVPCASTQASKEDGYGRLSVLLAERAIVLPQQEELLRQLGGVVAEATSNGGLRIRARTEATHDDLPDALTLAIMGLPRHLAQPKRRDVPEGATWVETGAGVRVPVPVRTLPAELDWGEVYTAREAELAGKSEDFPNPWADVYPAHSASDLAQLRQTAVRGGGFPGMR